MNSIAVRVHPQMTSDFWVVFELLLPLFSEFCVLFQTDVQISRIFLPFKFRQNLLMLHYVYDIVSGVRNVDNKVLNGYFGVC